MFKKCRKSHANGLNYLSTSEIDCSQQIYTQKNQKQLLLINQSLGDVSFSFLKFVNVDNILMYI